MEEKKRDMRDIRDMRRRQHSDTLRRLGSGRAGKGSWKAGKDKGKGRAVEGQEKAVEGQEKAVGRQEKGSGRAREGSGEAGTGQCTGKGRQRQGSGRTVETANGKAVSDRPSSFGRYVRRPAPIVPRLRGVTASERHPEESRGTRLGGGILVETREADGRKRGADERGRRGGEGLRGRTGPAERRKAEGRATPEEQCSMARAGIGCYAALPRRSGASLHTADVSAH